MLRRLLLILWYAGTAIVVLAALGLSVGRLALPLLDARSDALEQRIEAVIGQDVGIGRLELNWYRFGPELRIHDVKVNAESGETPLLQAREVRIAFDIPASLWRGQPVPSRLIVLGSDVSLSRAADGHLAVHGIHGLAPQASPWLLVLAQPHVELRDIRLQWHDALAVIPDLQLSDINLHLRNRGTRHQLEAQLQLPVEYGARLQISADFTGASSSFADWDGALHATVEQAALARWLAPYTAVQWRFDGRLSAALWATLKAGSVQNVRGTLLFDQPSVARSDNAASAFSAQRIATRLDWQRAKPAVPGWTLQLADLQVDRDGAAGIPTALTLVQHQRDDRDGQWQLAVDQLQLEALAPLLVLLPALTPEQQNLLQQLQPGGVLRDVRVDAGRAADGTLDALVYRLRVEALQTTPVDRLPGVSAISGQLSGDLTRGQLQLDSRDATLALPRLFRDPLQLSQLEGRIDWRHRDARWRIETAALRAENADLKTLSRLLLDIPDDGGKPFLELQSSFSDGNVEAAHKYLPVGIMPPRTVAWLDRALVSGRLRSGGVLFQGRFGGFPFDHAEGRLEVRATVSDGVLDYREGWHRIEGLEAELAFINRRMHIHGVAGKILGSELPEVNVRIEDMAHARLDIDGQASGTLADMLRFLRDSPLSEGRTEALDALAASGAAQLQLALRLPLSKSVPDKLSVSGTLSLPDNRLDLAAWDLSLEQLKGELQFTQSGMSGRNLSAQLLGVPVKLDVSDAPDGEPMTRIRARGKLPLLQKLRGATGGMDYVSGSSDWSAAVFLPKRTADAPPARLELRSELLGTVVDLPEPFGKPADASTPLTVAMQLKQNALGPVSVHYGDHSAALLLQREQGDMRLLGGELKFGAADAVLPEGEGLWVAGQLPAFDWDAWRAIAGGGLHNDLLRALNVKFERLHAFDRTFLGVEIRAQREAGHWIAQLGGPDMQGTLELPPDKPLQLRCTKLRIPAVTKIDGAVTRIDPAALPALDVDVQQLQFRDLQLGHVNLQTEPLIDTGLAVKALQVEADWLRFAAQGEWTRRDEQEASRFKIELQGGELGKMLKEFGYAGSIEGGETTGLIDANWAGSPAEFALARLEGSMDVDIGEGVLLNVEAGAGRLFGLLNIQGLRRRLSLDFSDVFAKGFGFDRITGHFSLLDGDAYTDNLQIEGPAARVEVSGRTGLAKRDYDQLVTVSPQVQSTIPLAGAIAGGPAVGAALLLADKLLGKQIQDLTSFTRYQYTVTGSWDEPVFTPVSHEAARGLQQKPPEAQQPAVPEAPNAIDQE